MHFYSENVKLSMGNTHIQNKKCIYVCRIICVVFQVIVERRVRFGDDIETIVQLRYANMSRVYPLTYSHYCKYPVNVSFRISLLKVKLLSIPYSKFTLNVSK